MRCAAASRHVLPVAALGCSVLALSACGSDRSSLPPKPAKGTDYVSLALLARYPEVYAQAAVSTIGVVTKAGKHAFRISGPGVRTKITLTPASTAAPDLGRRVEVSGLFTVSFTSGYVLALGSIVLTGG
jgi:hypothetical protein